MKQIITRGAAVAALAATLAAAAASAHNSTVENALKSRPELSMFYQGLVSTGVINELKEGQPYTVFAPTNDAFAKIPQSQYPCFYSRDCREQSASVLRNHIVEGEKHVRDASHSYSRGNTSSVMSLFSINNNHAIISEPQRDDYAIDGRNIVQTDQLLGGMLYEIDGVLASQRDLVQFSAPQVAVVNVTNTRILSANGLPPRVPQGNVVTITTETPGTAVIVPGEGGMPGDTTTVVSPAANY